LDESLTTLQTAQDLISAGQTQTAAGLLIPVVLANPNHAQAWYLLGLALDDRQKKIDSFNQVLRIDPSRLDARDQLDRLSNAEILPPAVAPFIESSEPKFEREAIPGQEPPAPTAASARKPGPTAAGWVIIGSLAAIFIIFISLGLWVYTRSHTPKLTPAPTETRLPHITVVPYTPTPAAAMFTPVFKARACTFSIPLGTRVKCGTVSVPLDREKNYTDLLELPVALFQSVKPGADVIFYLQGGPGQDAIKWSTTYFDDFVQPALQEYDMLFFDPRGTGQSKPAPVCPELNSVFLDSYYQTLSGEQAYAEFNALWAKCHDRLVAAGIDPAAFTTNQSAQDVADIARALGYEKINLLGISYGTRVALELMRDNPAVVGSAVLDSTVPVQAKIFNQRADDVQYALQKMFSDCALSTRCNTAYPDLEKVFNTLIERFELKPANVKVFSPVTGYSREIKVNGTDMLSAIVWGLHTSALTPVVPKAIYDIDAGDYTFLTYALGEPANEYKDLNLATYFATVCSEQIYASTPEQVDSDLGTSSVLKKFALVGIFGSSQRVFDLCRAWGARDYDPHDSQPVTSDIPTMILAGQYDPTTPVTNAILAAASLSHSHLEVVPGVGHAVTASSPCAYKMAMAFFRDPAAAPDQACLHEKTFEFFLPFDGSSPMSMDEINDPAKMVKGLVPSGWTKDLHSATYYRHAYLFDPTLVSYASITASASRALSSISGNFASVGFDTTPQKTGTHKANGLNWMIYSAKYNGEPVLLALAQVSSYKTLGIIMVVSAPELKGYTNGLLIPILDAYAPR